jgi:hypothetical protein
MRIPERYSSENATEEDKEIYNHYINIMENLNKPCRGAVIDNFGNILWEESEEDFQKRLQDL